MNLVSSIAYTTVYAMLELRLQRENYQMKTLRTVYPYGLNEHVKSINKDIPTGKLFPSLPRHNTKFIEHKSHSTTKGRLSDLDSFVHTITLLQ